MQPFKRMLTLFNSKEKELVFDLQELEWFSLETLGKMKEMRASSHPLEKKMNIYTKLRAQMTLLPSLLQPIHPNAITQSKGQKCPSTSKKMTKSKTLA